MAAARSRPLTASGDETPCDGDVLTRGRALHEVCYMKKQPTRAVRIRPADSPSPYREGIRRLEIGRLRLRRRPEPLSHGLRPPGAGDLKQQWTWLLEIQEIQLGLMKELAERKGKVELILAERLGLNETVAMYEAWN